jgi:NodT family efflux transporter outer membrane factor (OMF) lipoprotein
MSGGYRRGAGVLGLLLAGCTVGPDYVKPPPVATPVAYKEVPAADSAEAGIWLKARPEDGAPRGKWWEAFGDPELNALEEQVTVANQDLKAAEARFRQARALIGVQQAAQYPALSVQPGVGKVRDSENQPYAPKPNPNPLNSLQLPFDLSYEIDLWGRVRRTVAATRDEAQATAADLETARLSLHAELAIDYIELRSADAQQKLLDDTVAAYTDALQLTENRLNGGAAPESDVAQAQTQLETTRVQATDVAVQRAQFEHALAVLIGQPPAQFSLPARPWQLDPPPVPASLPSELLQRRPDIAAAERRMAEANEQIGIAEAAFYPTVNLASSAGFIGTAATNWFIWPSLAWSVGMTMTQTLFDAGRRSSVSEAAIAGYDTTVAEYRSTTLTAFQQVEDNLAALRILERERRQQQAATAAAENSLRLFNDRYVGGLDTYLAVVIAQSAALQNQRNDVDIQRRRIEADILLVKALGGGWTADELPPLTGPSPHVLDVRLPGTGSGLLPASSGNP